MDKKNMLHELISHYDNGNKSQFSKRLGVTAQAISTWLNRSTFDNELIFSKCEYLNAEWLLTGKGDMIKRETPDIHILHQPKYTEIRSDQDIRLYDIQAAANLKTLFINKDQNILGEIRIPNIPKCDGAVYVIGDSMYPLLKSGDIVAYKEIHNIQNVVYGEMYLISYDIDGDEYLVVKYINRSDYKDKVKLVSYNTHHEPQDIPWSSINALAIVKFSIRKNTMI